MAKRYFSYEDIKDIQGKFKPGGTLGSHYCTITPTPDGVYVGSFDLEFDVLIKPGDTLGYDCGSVWRLPNPETIKNPVKKWAAIRKCKVEYVDDLKVAAEKYDDLHGTYNDRGRALYFTGTQIVHGDADTCFVVVRSVKHMNGLIGKYWHRLVIKKGAKQNDVMKVIEPVGAEADLSLCLLDWIGFGRE